MRYDGRDLLPLETSAGISFIQEKYLAPLDSLEYMQLFERRSTDGGLYIVAKVGMIIQAVIMPMNLPNETFMDLKNRRDSELSEWAGRGLKSSRCERTYTEVAVQ